MHLKKLETRLLACYAYLVTYLTLPYPVRFEIYLTWLGSKFWMPLKKLETRLLACYAYLPYLTLPYLTRLGSKFWMPLKKLHVS